MGGTRIIQYVGHTRRIASASWLLWSSKGPLGITYAQNLVKEHKIKDRSET